MKLLIVRQRTGDLILLLCATASPLSGQHAGIVRWSWLRSVPAGLTITLEAVRGQIRIVPAPGELAMVSGILQGRHDAPELVKMLVGTTSAGVGIRTRYPAGSLPPLVRRGECLPSETLLGDFWDSDVTVDLIVRVPAGVRVNVRLMWGDIDATAVSNPMDLQTQNGSVRRNRSPASYPQVR
jgi:hypothetical protein